MECYCYHRDVQDLVLDGKTPHERRDEEQVSCPSIVFGAKSRISSDFSEETSEASSIRQESTPRPLCGL